MRMVAAIEIGKIPTVSAAFKAIKIDRTLILIVAAEKIHVRVEDGNMIWRGGGAAKKEGRA